MAKHWARTGVILIALAFATAPAEAAFIEGSIDFVGAITLQGTDDVNTATGVTFGTVVVAADLPVAQLRDYSGVPALTPVTFQDINPFGAPIDSLWSFSVGPIDFSFDLATLNVEQSVPDFLLMDGLGIVKVTGFDDTPAKFLFSSQQTTAGLATIAFSATTIAQGPAAIPEPGSLVLLATGLFGVGSAIRRRFAHRT